MLAGLGCVDISVVSQWWFISRDCIIVFSCFPPLKWREICFQFSLITVKGTIPKRRLRSYRQPLPGNVPSPHSLLLPPLFSFFMLYFFLNYGSLQAGPFGLDWFGLLSSQNLQSVVTMQIILFFRHLTYFMEFQNIQWYLSLGTL